MMFLGTKKERGLLAWTNQTGSEGTSEESRKKFECYDMPFGNDWIYKYVYFDKVHVKDQSIV